MTTSSTPPAEKELWRPEVQCPGGPNFLNLILPSCGLRRSEMSRSHMIFKRVTMAWRKCRHFYIGNCKPPSMRKRIPVFELCREAWVHMDIEAFWL